MRWQEHRMLFAVIFSLISHCGILVCAKIVSNPTLLATTSEEIYEASDVMFDYVSNVDEKTAQHVRQIAKHHVTQIEFVLVDGSIVDKLLGNSKVIAREVEDERLKAAKKTIPVVKNPSVKPRLIYQTPIPYPTEAGGKAGVVVICFLVGYDGVPEYTSTAESSGNRFLDGAAVDACFNWRFSPAKDSKGRLVRCLVYIPVTVKP